MSTTTNKHLTFIVYDSILNSVFESMVLTPLLKLLKESSNLEITLISFEPMMLSKHELIRAVPAHDKLHLVICRRLPFIGKISLRLAAWQLKRVLRHLSSHQIIARGPLAGWLAQRVLERISRKNPERMRVESDEQIPYLSIQARGLCAQEYRFERQQQPTGYLRHLFDTYIYRRLHTIEFEVYRNKRKTDYPSRITIEAVSPALKHYLIHNFRAQAADISIAVKDIPPHIDTEQVLAWRHEVRTELSIAHNAMVYVYAGSAKPWQCIAEMLFFFTEQRKKDPTAYFLILTNQPRQFSLYLKNVNLPADAYRIKTVAPHEIYRYLSAGNAGLLFRRKDVINWVARPTKMLEYQAVGLKIIHNETVAWLAAQGHGDQVK